MVGEDPGACWYLPEVPGRRTRRPGQGLALEGTDGLAIGLRQFSHAGQSALSKRQGDSGQETQIRRAMDKFPGQVGSVSASGDVTTSKG